jgi:hypothetical protein
MLSVNEEKTIKQLETAGSWFASNEDESIELSKGRLQKMFDLEDTEANDGCRVQRRKGISAG